MKKLITLILVLSVILTFVSCSADGTASKNENANPIVVLPDNETTKTVNGYKALLNSSEVQSANDSSNVSSSSETQAASSIYERKYSYIGSKNTKKFHSDTCRYAKKINESNAIIFESSQEATENGYIPCSVCNP